MPTDTTQSQELIFLRACRREPVERTPIWIMRQAGRYLPEYREVRAKVDFLTSCRTPEIACELTLQPIRRLGVDAAILFSDILIPLPGMGVPVAFDPGPRIDNPVRTRAAVEALRTPDAAETTGFVMDAVRLIRRELEGKTPLIGFAGAPFTMAAYLVEGGGSKSFAALKAMLFSEPATASLLLEKCAFTVASYLGEQVRAGAQAAMLFDTWAGLLSPQDYATFAMPFARSVIEAVRAVAPVPIIYYAGEPAGYLEAAAMTGADVLGIDWRIDLDVARARVGDGVALQGNLDPTILLGPKPLIEARAREILMRAHGAPSSHGAATRDQSGRGSMAKARPETAGRPISSEGPIPPAIGHIFNLGHGIVPETPPDHAAFLVDVVHRASESTAG